MEKGNRFGQEPGFSIGQSYDRPVQSQRFVGDITIGSNGRVIQPGQERRSHGPVPGTSNRRQRNNGQRNK